jgi:hypothetical protein
MAGYAVIARIGRVEPHLTLGDLERDLVRDVGRDPEAAWLAQGTDAGPRAVDAGDVSIVIVREPAIGRLAERLDRMRELWTQTTFYLFDADSWRT